MKHSNSMEANHFPASIIEQRRVREELSLNPAKKNGRGGARAGAGRKATKGPSQQVHIDVPLEIMARLSPLIKETRISKTDYIVGLIEKDLKSRANNAPSA
jgi:hypothetical protein